MSLSNHSPSSTDRIVWIDCEMTGLDLGADALVEVAAVVTDSELNVLGDGVDVVITPPQAAVEQMGDFVRDMHTTSGLLDALADGTTLAEAEAAVLAYVRAWVPEPGKAPLAGNSVGTDKAFLDRDMPGLIRELGPRMMPTSKYGYLMQQLALSGWTSLPWLWLLKQPVLIMAGDDDPVIPLANAKIMSRLIKNCRLHVVHDGHLFLVSDPAGSSRVVRDFLEAPQVTARRAAVRNPA